MVVRQQLRSPLLLLLIPILTTTLTLTTPTSATTTSSSSSTYSLSYDALISPSTVAAHASLTINNHPSDSFSTRLVPPTLVEEATRGIGTKLFRNWVDYSVRVLGEDSSRFMDAGEGGGGVPLGFGCFPQEMAAGNVEEEKEEMVGGTICSMDYNSIGFSFQISATVYRGEGTLEDYGFVLVDNTDDDNGDNNGDDNGDDDESEPQEDQSEEDTPADLDDDTDENLPQQSLTTPPPVPVAIRLDITLTTTTDSYSSRDALVEIIPTITTVTHASAYPVGPIWSIEERATPFQKMVRERERTTRRSRGRKEASLETLVLDNDDLALRIPVVSSSQKIRAPPSSSSEESESESSEPTTTTYPNNLDIWHTLPSPTSPTPHRSLFLNSTLRTTTLPHGSAHIEAFVHPALMSHSSSRRILLLSDMPLGLIKEILKYENVEELVLLGVDDVAALEMGGKMMPVLDDCSGIEGRGGGSCLECGAVTLVVMVEDDDDDDDDDDENGTDDITERWLERQLEEAEESELMEKCELLSEQEEDKYNTDGLTGADDESYYCSEHPFFDVVMVDVSLGTEEKWLDEDFMWQLKGLMTPESIMVLNIGSAPRYGGGGDGGVLEKARDRFLEIATRGEDLGGLGFTYVHVYDEPLAAPLDDAYIIAFNSDEAYYSFIQKNPTGSEIEFIRRMRSQTTGTTTGGQTLLPTMFYDGYSHERYITPSRSWENWFCTSYEPGRTSYACETFRHKWSNKSYHSYATEVRHHPVKGRSLFTSSPVPAGHFLLPQDAYLSLQLDYFQWAELNSFVERFPDALMFKDLHDFFITYGFETNGYGSSGWSVSYTNSTFTNHACTVEDVSVNYLTELYEQADLYEEGDEEGGFVFSPLLVRRVHTLNQLVVAVRDLGEGELVEIDYSSFRKDSPEFLSWLDGVCRTGVGLVPVEEKSGDGDGEGELEVEVDGSSY